MRSLLAWERTALNFLQRLSGIATLTARFVAEVEGTKATILDTRKTTPGWRALEKYAVRCGGGRNHRFGLYDAVLIKDNHLAWLATGADPIGAALASARAHAPTGMVIEIEVDTLEGLDRALECGPDIILVDNFDPDRLAEAVRRRDARAPEVQLEASGGVTLAGVAALARTGVDRISVGALTTPPPRSTSASTSTGHSRREHPPAPSTARRARRVRPAAELGETRRACGPTSTSCGGSGSRSRSTPTAGLPTGRPRRGSAPTRSNTNSGHA
jgi:hypothetical protein